VRPQQQGATSRQGTLDAPLVRGALDAPLDRGAAVVAAGGADSRGVTATAGGDESRSGRPQEATSRRQLSAESAPTASSAPITSELHQAPDVYAPKKPDDIKITFPKDYNFVNEISNRPNNNNKNDITDMYLREYVLKDTSLPSVVGDSFLNGIRRHVDVGRPAKHQQSLSNRQGPAPQPTLPRDDRLLLAHITGQLKQAQARGRPAPRPSISGIIDRLSSLLNRAGWNNFDN